MNTTLYYFSGTGNSFSVAKNLASILGDTNIISIPSVMKESSEVIPPSGKVGIICPVYDAGIPVLVREFLSRLNIRNSSYVFGIATFAGTGGSALKMMNNDLLEHNTKGLDAGFLVKMPGNFPPLYVPPSGLKVTKILQDADIRIKRIAESIREEKHQKIGMFILSSLMQAALYGGFAKSVHTLDEKFSVSDACTGCGACVKVCPVKNISFENERPVYHHHCELCCACLNYCPVQAIDLSLLRGTKGRGRYHHPEVSVTDMNQGQGEFL
ncbi:EFR1 family ferrodoxin [Methanospirillum stamsii]|uniref:4Fe-4S ferredoxin n=1 Tax=Methanospirillum stamsii TaxID=1277351 RepID=A0A2V2NLV9_9EURY|nr:EFR1 family ferrodoxin [Methanospirillum stamsii]PWR76313.1 4Fe-4S ferredoxin [Methanospirillum stamsii]